MIMIPKENFTLIKGKTVKRVARLAGLIVRDFYEIIIERVNQGLSLDLN